MPKYDNPAAIFSSGKLVQPITDFQQDLAKSVAAEDNLAVQAAIRQCFPDCLKTHRAHQQNDRLGVDVWIERPMAVMTPVDLKIRSVDYGWWRNRRPMDAALELSFGDGPGWARRNTAAAQYLFVCTDTGRSAAFNARELREALKWNLDAWSRRFKVIMTLTKSWHGEPVESQALCVPVDVLDDACAEVRGVA